MSASRARQAAALFPCSSNAFKAMFFQTVKSAAVVALVLCTSQAKGMIQHGIWWFVTVLCLLLFLVISGWLYVQYDGQCAEA